MACHRISEYSHDRLSASDRARFESHVVNCPECRVQVNKTELLEREFSSMAWGGERRQPPWNQATRDKLIAYAAKRNAVAADHWPLRPLLAAAAVALIAVAAVFYLSQQTQPSTTMDRVSTRLVGRLFTAHGTVHNDSFNPAVGELLQSPQDGRLLLDVGDDTVGLDRNSQLKVDKITGDETRLLLTRGQVACQVKKRQPGSRFVVVTKNRQVTVTGTRFSVKADRTALTVTVVEGSVEVTGDNGRGLPVKTGETLRLVEGEAPVRSVVDRAHTNTVEQLLSESPKWESPYEDKANGAQEGAAESPLLEGTAPTISVRERDIPRHSRTKTVPTVTHWRDMMLAGRLPEAEQGLVAHLGSHPREVEAWWLLATCRRKSGNWEPAVSAYRKVIALGGPAQVDKARFRAGVILQDQLGRHREAVPLLRDYVQASPKSNPLRAEAMARLAESLLAMGQKAEAARILKEITGQYGQTPAPDRARKILDSAR